MLIKAIDNIINWAFSPYIAYIFENKLDDKNFFRLAEINKIAGTIFLGMVIGKGPFCKGVAVGAVEAISNLCCLAALNSLFPSYLENIEEDDNPVFDDFEVAILAPMKEEIIYRGILQGVVRKVAEYAFKDRELITIKGHKITIAKAVTIIIPAMIFAYRHRNSTIHIVAAIVYGILAEHYGLAASMGAHMFNNSSSVVVSFVIEVFDDGVGQQTTSGP